MYGYGYYQQPPEESVYNLIPQPKPVAERPPMYRSKYPHNTPPTASTFGRSTASQILTTNIAGDYQMKGCSHRHQGEGSSFGPKTVHYSDPTTYLKKQTKPGLPQPKAFKYTDRRKPKLEKTKAPKASKAGTAKAASKRNFLTENALNCIMSDPGKKPQPKVSYLKKSDYGKIPAYLGQVKQEIAAEKEYIRQVMAKEMEEQMKAQPKMKLLPEDERLKLLKTLKEKWEHVNKQYQGMTHIVTLDTIGKVRRKEEYESQLQQLEKSIEKLSKKYVYVA